MRILLIKPPNKEMAYAFPTLGFGYLSALLKKAGHETRVVNCIKEDKKRAVVYFKKACNLGFAQGCAYLKRYSK